MRILTFAVIVLFVGGCGGIRVSSPLDAGHPDAGSTDAGSATDSGSDDSGTPDAGSPDGGDGGLCEILQGCHDLCESLTIEVNGLIEGPQPCMQISDCTVISTPCGLAGVCGAVVNVATASSIVPPVSDFVDAGCIVSTSCPECPVLPGLATCTNGQCAVGAGAGEACAQDTDCPAPRPGSPAPRCLTDGGFADGYCAQQCSDGWGCPLYNLTCESVPGGPAGPGYCFEDCATNSDCRSDAGYLCCPSWAPPGLGSSGSVCYPGPCPTVDGG